MSNSEESSPSETFLNFKKVEGVEFKVIVCADLFDWMNGKTFNGLIFRFGPHFKRSLTETKWCSDDTHMNTENAIKPSKTWSCTKGTFEKVKEALNTANREWARETKRQFWHDFSKVENVDRYIVESSEEIKDLKESYSEKEFEDLKRSIMKMFK